MLLREDKREGVFLEGLGWHAVTSGKVAQQTGRAGGGGARDSQPQWLHRAVPACACTVILSYQFVTLSPILSPQPAKCCTCWSAERRLATLLPRA